MLLVVDGSVARGARTDDVCDGRSVERRVVDGRARRAISRASAMRRRAGRDCRVVRDGRWAPGAARRGSRPRSHAVVGDDARRGRDRRVAAPDRGARARSSRALRAARDRPRRAAARGWRCVDLREALSPPPRSSVSSRRGRARPDLLRRSASGSEPNSRPALFTAPLPGLAPTPHEIRGRSCSVSI